MSFWTFAFIIAAMAIVAGVITTWMQTRHSAKDDDGAEASRKFDAICAENRALKQQVEELTKRLTVLERIATDPAERVSREIEELR